MKTRVIFLVLLVLSTFSMLYCQRMAEHFYDVVINTSVTTLVGLQHRGVSTNEMTAFSTGVFISLIVLIASAIGFTVSLVRAIRRKRRDSR